MTFWRNIFIPAIIDTDITMLALRGDIIDKKRQNVSDEITLKKYVELAKTIKEMYEKITIILSVGS